jgi:REP element-mobilizing transposase RayT
MPQSFATLLVHAVFSTKDRQPILASDLTARLFPYMGGIVREMKGTALTINGTNDHVHLLLQIPTAVAVAEMLRVVKTNSSRWVHEQFPEHARFAWQGGYGAFTVSHSRADAVSHYIATQKEHHRKVSFQEEFLALLNKHGISCDPSDLWG